MFNSRAVLFRVNENDKLEFVNYISVPEPEDCEVVTAVIPETTNQKIYPNPVVSKLYINNDTPIRTVSMTDAVGRQFYYRDNLNNVRLEIDLSAASDGMFIVELIDAHNKVSRRKMIKE